MDKVCAAFVKAQRDFGPALKSSTNPHFKSKYANLTACVEAVIDALNKHDIALMQYLSPSNDGITIETKFIHESGEILSGGQVHMPAIKQDPQAYGSAMTYARRYSLMAACGIAAEDDDGNRALVNESQIMDFIAAIETSSTQEEMMELYLKAHAACNGNQEFQKKVIAAKAARVKRGQEERKKEQA